MKKAFLTNSASRKRAIGAVVMVAMLAACSNGSGRPTTGNLFNKKEVPLENFTAEQIFERGEFELENRRPHSAVVSVLLLLLLF